jgi:hypothetical protein
MCSVRIASAFYSGGTVFESWSVILKPYIFLGIFRRMKEKYHEVGHDYSASFYLYLIIHNHSLMSLDTKFIACTTLLI